jgi:RNA polymerase sigma factor (TIGR02999 family)
VSPDDTELEHAVYEHLRALAGRIHSDQGAPQTLQPTALAHEAWLKLSRSGVQVQGRAHFLAVAARAMRQILVDRARARNAAKRGGGALRTTLHGLSDGMPDTLDVLAFDRVLDDLEALDPMCAEVVLMRTYGGMTVPEAAEALGVSTSSVNRAWRFAGAYLGKRLADT